ncbi:MAG: major capsid protein [Clostridia bacterium]|nr:major capsid protein [Clostridia bacterium]
MNLTEFRKLVTPKIIAANWTEAVSNKIPYIGESLFPSKQKAGLDLKWIKGRKGLPISLMPTAFDAKTTFRGREGVSFTETQMPFFREGFRLSEEDRQNILRIQEKGDPYLTDALNRVFDDAANLLEGALVVAERERMQLLFPENGDMGISIEANGVKYVYDYDPNDVWKGTNYFELTGTGTWASGNATTADPLGDIQRAQDAISAQGGEGSLLMMNSATFKLFRALKAIKDLFLTVNGMAVGYLTDAQITGILKDTLRLEGIIVYDKKYKDESGVEHKFVPDDYVAVLPDGTLGNTWRGTTPEEADLRGSGIADVAVVNNGIAIAQFMEADPVNVFTKASEIVLPSFERMNEVALIKVK